MKLFPRVFSTVTVLSAVACILTAQGTTGQDRRVAAAGAASAQIIDDLVAANRILVNEGILDGLGHVSVRHDRKSDRFLLSRDLAPALVTAADLMEFDLDGNPVDARGREMYQERFIHAAIYKARPDVQSVIHAHTRSLLAFAGSSTPLRAVSHVASFLVGGVPVFEIRQVAGATGMLVNDGRTGTALARMLGGRPVALMRGHGIVVVGPTIPETVSRAIHSDVNARVQAQAIALGGTVKYLEVTDVEPSRSPASNAPGTLRSWAYWKQRATGK